MNDWLIAHAASLRFLLVAGVLAALLLGQILLPRRGDVSPRGRRLRNVALALIGSVVVWLLLPLTAVSFAAVMANLRFGLFNNLQWPPALEFCFVVVALDLAIYWQHRWMHLVPWLWRLHRVHHSDTQFDVTLGLRFHPLEILLSLLYKFVVIAVLGATPLSVLVYEILLALFALITHADLAIPPRWDRSLRRVIVTPDWHRVHHSIHRNETDSNYGNILSVWDRLFVSRIEQPSDGHSAMQIGLGWFRDDQSQKLPALLAQPFARDHSRETP